MSEFAQPRCFRRLEQAVYVRARGHGNCVGGLCAQLTVALSAACMYGVSGQSSDACCH